MEKPKRLYFVSSGVRNLLEGDVDEQLKVTACGLKILERQEFKVSGFLGLEGIESKLMLCITVLVASC